VTGGQEVGVFSRGTEDDNGENVIAVPKAVSVERRSFRGGLTWLQLFWHWWSGNTCDMVGGASAFARFVLEIPEVVSSSLQTQACVDVFLTVSLCESTKPDSNRAGVSTERCNEFEYPRRRSAVLRCDADLLCKVGPGCEFLKAGFGVETWWSTSRLS